MKNKLLAVGVLSLSLLLTNCKKDDESTIIPQKATHPTDTCLATKEYTVFKSSNDTNYILKEYNPDATISIERNFYNGLDKPSYNIEYEYDDKGRLIQKGPTYYVFDLNGNLVFEGASSISIYMTYDERGNMIERYQQGPSRFSSHAYYTYNNKNQRITERYTPSDTVDRYESQYSYNNKGYVIKREGVSIKNGIPTVTSVVDYEYDSKGNKIKETTSSVNPPSVTSVVTYAYDMYNNLIEETSQYGQSVSVKTYKRKYDSKGNQTYLEIFTNSSSTYYTIYEYTCWE